MKDRLPALIAVALLLVLVLTTWWAADYAQRAVTIEPPRRITHEPDSWSRNFVMVRTDASGVPINRIEGEYMQHYPDDDSYEVTKARAVGQQVGTPMTIATSNTAIMEKAATRIVMNGDAHVHRVAYEDRGPLDVTSEQLIVLPDEEIVYTDLPALVVQGNSTMHGKGMRYDNKTRVLQVFSASDVKIAGQDVESAPSQKQSQTGTTP